MYKVHVDFCILHLCSYFLLLDDVKGIPEFWLTAMKNVDMLADMIQVCTVLLLLFIFEGDQQLFSPYVINIFAEYTGNEN